jgi:hypothetical protein
MVEHDGDEKEIGEEGREGLVAVAEERGERRRGGTKDEGIRSSSGSNNKQRGKR